MAKQGKFTIAHFRRTDKDNQGRIVNNSGANITELGAVMSEAVQYGFDIQYTQPKSEESQGILFFSRN